MDNSSQDNQSKEKFRLQESLNSDRLSIENQDLGDSTAEDNPCNNVEPSQNPDHDLAPSAHQPQLSPQGRDSLEMSWQAPFLPPNFIREYDSVVSNGAERVFALTEKEQAHRHSSENRALDLEERGMSINENLERGQTKRANGVVVVGSVLAIMMVAGGFRLIEMGKSGAGVAAVIAPVAGLLGILYTRKLPKNGSSSEELDP